jgi:drug/metabolite transporter, DME family
MRGVMLVLAAAMLWGTTGTAQSLAPAQLSSYWIGASRLAVAAAFFLPWLAVSDRAALTSRRVAALPWRGIVCAAACMCLYNLAFFAGVRSAGIAVGTAIALGSGPVWAGALEALLRARMPSAAWWFGTTVAVAGVALMIAGPGSANAPAAIGVVLCLAAGLAYAVYTLVNKQMVSRAPAGAVTSAVFVCAAALAMPIAAGLAGPPAIRITDLAIVAWLGVMSTALAYLLFSHALRHISGATAVALALAEPVTAFALAVAVVGERPGLTALLGLIGVLLGLGSVIKAELSGVRRPRPA